MSSFNRFVRGVLRLLVGRHSRHRPVYIALPPSYR